METRINELQSFIINSNGSVFDTFDDFVHFVAECDEYISKLSDELKRHQLFKLKLLQRIQLLLAENQEALERWYATQDSEKDELRSDLKEFFTDRLIHIDNLKRANSPQNYEAIAKAINELKSVKELAIQK